MGDKKAKKGKIPKRVGGVKVPKAWRKSGNALIDTVNSPVGQQMLATGLASVVATVAARLATPPDAMASGSPPPAGPAPDPHAAGEAFARSLIGAFGTAARAALDRHAGETDPG